MIYQQILPMPRYLVIEIADEEVEANPGRTRQLVMSKLSAALYDEKGYYIDALAKGLVKNPLQQEPH